MMEEDAEKCMKLSTENISELLERSSANTEKKLSHKKWKALLKKQKRKAQRQQSAQERDCNKLAEEKQREASPTYQQRLKVEEEQREWEEAQQECQRQLNHVMWLERERLVLEQLAENKRREEEQLQRKKEEEERIKAEWEERQKKEKEEEEERQQKEKDRKSKQVTGTSNRTKVSTPVAEATADDNDSMLKEARSNERVQQEDGSWHNPLAPMVQGKEIENCPFFMKTGCCRFGDRCSRSHPYPDFSCTLLFPGMYAHFSLSQGLNEEYDTDLSLEYEEGETYHHFREFYEDVLPEFKEVGRIVQFKVSCNYEPHLRGNVYVQYKREEDAQRAFMQFNGRWYASRQLQCEFSGVNKWKNALCGLFRSKRCPKGKNCNFLHTFRNPGGEFWEADRDFDTSEPRSERRRDWRDSDRSHRAWQDRRGQRQETWDYSRDYSRSRNSYTSRRSRSPYRSQRSSVSSGRSKRSRSRSPKRYKHDKSRSPRRQRKSRSRSPRRSRQSKTASSGTSQRSVSIQHDPNDTRNIRSESRSPSTPRAKVKSHSLRSAMAWESSDDDDDLGIRTQESQSQRKNRKAKKHKKDKISRRSKDRLSRSRSRSRSPHDSPHQKHKHKKHKKHKKQKQKDERECAHDVGSEDGEKHIIANEDSVNNVVTKPGDEGDGTLMTDVHAESTESLPQQKTCSEDHLTSCSETEVGVNGTGLQG